VSEEADPLNLLTDPNSNPQRRHVAASCPGRAASLARAPARGNAKWTKRGVPPGARGRSDARPSAEFPYFTTDSPQDPALRFALESAEKACAGWNIGAKSPIAARRP